MARSVNKTILIGHLGQEPEMRYTGSGTAVTNMRLATTESYTNNDGDEVEKTEWHNVVAWSSLAEVCNEYLGKGSQVYIEGKLQTRSWEDRDGNTRYTTEVKAHDVMFLDSKPGGGTEGSPREGRPGAASPEPSGKRQGPPPQEEEGATFEPDDGDQLPF